MVRSDHTRHRNVRGLLVVPVLVASAANLSASVIMTFAGRDSSLAVDVTADNLRNLFCDIRFGIPMLQRSQD